MVIVFNGLLWDICLCWAPNFKTFDYHQLYQILLTKMECLNSIFRQYNIFYNFKTEPILMISIMSWNCECLSRFFGILMAKHNFCLMKNPIHTVPAHLLQNTNLFYPATMYNNARFESLQRELLYHKFSRL